MTQFKVGVNGSGNLECECIHWKLQQRLNIFAGSQNFSKNLL